MHWFYLFIAACMEAAWTFSLKFLTFKDLRLLRFDNFYSPTEGLPILLPFLGYIIFGIGNIYFFSMAMKEIPTATCFAVWTAITMVLLKATEITVFKQTISTPELFFALLIMVGIIGLKVYAPTK